MDLLKRALKRYACILREGVTSRIKRCSVTVLSDLLTHMNASNGCNSYSYMSVVVAYLGPPAVQSGWIRGLWVM